MSTPSLQWIPVVPVLHLHRYYGFLRPLPAHPGSLRSPLTTRLPLVTAEARRSPTFVGNPSESVPRARDSGGSRASRVAALVMRPSVGLTTSASATILDFGAESARPAPLRVYASPRRSPGAGARLTTGLPATALTGLDLHQLDSIQRFHVLMNVPPLPRFRGAIAWIPTDGRGLTNGGESELFWGVYWEWD